MNRSLRIVKAVVPAGARRLLRAAHRRFVFGRAMRRFLRHPEASLRGERSVIRDLVYGWGNETWSALDDYLVACLDRALSTSGPVLECGSGLSTLLVGAIAQRRGYRHWALEHTPQWAEKVARHLERYGIRSVVLSAKPLKDYGEFCWYDPPMEMMPDDFALVVCDGPPSDSKGGRYGLVPVMRERLADGCVILLDDAHREAEQAIVRRWGAELGITAQTFGSSDRYFEISVPATRARATRS